MEALKKASVRAVVSLALVVLVVRIGIAIAILKHKPEPAPQVQPTADELCFGSGSIDACREVYNNNKVKYDQSEAVIAGLEQQKKLEKKKQDGYQEQNTKIRTMLSTQFPGMTFAGDLRLDGLTDKKPFTRWRLNSEGLSKAPFNVVGDTVDERTADLLHQFGFDFEQRDALASNYGIRTDVLACLARSETTLGQDLKSSNNIGNVGNNDRGDVIHYSSPTDGVKAILDTLANGTYLKNKTTLGDLYPYYTNEVDETYCTTDCDKAYATSPENAPNNVMNCLGILNGGAVTPSFSYKL